MSNLHAHAGARSAHAVASDAGVARSTPVVPIVDVGIPTLGESPSYLVEAVESVFAQTFSSWRLLISENGPGLDSVREALEPYVRDPRVEHVVSGTREGRGINWTRASQGSAPYIGLLHDDDSWAPEFLERRTEFLDKHPQVGLVYSGCVVIDEAGRPLGRSRVGLVPGIHRPESFLPFLYRKLFISVPTILIRRSAFNAVGAEYKDIIHLDTEMWLRLAASFDVACLAVWDAQYRIHPAQTSASRSALATEQLVLLDAVSDLPIRPSLRRIVLAEAHVRCALAAAERGCRREAIEHLTSAVRAAPSSLVRPAVAGRMLAAAAAVATGERGRVALAHRRERRWRSGGADGFLEMSQDRRMPRGRIDVDRHGVSAPAVAETVARAAPPPTHVGDAPDSEVR